MHGFISHKKIRLWVNKNCGPPLPPGGRIFSFFVEKNDNCLESPKKCIRILFNKFCPPPPTPSLKDTGGETFLLVSGAEQRVKNAQNRERGPPLGPAEYTLNSIYFCTNLLVRAECVRCPWLQSEPKVATILGIFPPSHRLRSQAS